MILAFHLIFGCYGFWPPNDPRGSWSTYVASDAIYRAAGKATTTTQRHSLAKRQHDASLRRAAKAAMKYPPVRLTGLQARVVGRGLGRACIESGYRALACCVMPDHVHLVLGRHAHDPHQIIGHLKGRATHLLNEEHLHPLQGYRRSNGATPTPWVEGGWVVFLDSDRSVVDRVRYVEQNPLEIGFPRQRWSFVTTSQSDAPRDATDAPPDATDAPLDATDAPLDATDAPRKRDG